MMLLHCSNVAQAFAEIVGRFGNRTAIAFNEGTGITYRQLDMLSNQAAHFMLSKGIRRGHSIALCLEKCPAAYALILAALKIGAVYVALDPRNPAARTESILRQCMPSMVFSNRRPVEEQSPAGTAVTVHCPETLESPAFCEEFATGPVASDQQAAGSDPAYIMFTSGSTGIPKGAVISHDNLLHFIGWIDAQYGFTPEDVHTHLNPLYFDNTVFDIYSTLFTGGMLVPFDYDSLQDPTTLVNRVKTMRCSVWFSVPSLLMLLQVMKVATRFNLEALRKIIFGGEGFPKPKLKQLFDEVGPEIELHNVYGPTECTCICSSYRISADDFRDSDGFPALGVLAGNFTQHILDHDRAVPEGEPGELCLGGCCVGLGYFNRPDLTVEAFVQNPLNNAFREILYRTGDLVRLNPADGKLYFVGRRDLQVKHMGYRIELEEVQHALIKIEGVDEAAVLQRKGNDLTELIAVIAAKCPLDRHALRKELANLIPAYMIPSKFHVVEQMPKNANGKTDRITLIRKFAS
jgi:D-alanine--poly(phosphoribitol) ligase subunit 1